MSQNDPHCKAVREAVRGVLAYARMDQAPAAIDLRFRAREGALGAYLSERLVSAVLKTPLILPIHSG